MPRCRREFDRGDGAAVTRLDVFFWNEFGPGGEKCFT